MRITIQFLPIILLFLLVPASLFYKITFPKLVLFALSLLQLRFVLVLIKVRGRSSDKRVILETMSMSHYVEKVRWVMDYLEIKYQEEENVGVLGLLILGRSVPQLKIPARGIYIENSSDILRYFYGKFCKTEAMTDFLRSSPETLELEVKFDVLGEDLRRFTYFHIFNSENLKEMEERAWGMFQPNIPTWQKYLLKLVSPISRRFVKHVLKVTREDSNESMKNAEKVFEELNERLSDGREFLMGTTEPTYIDFHLCSIAALLLQPPLYSGEVLTVDTKAVVDKLPVEFLERRKNLEKSLVGQYVLNTYNKFRRNTITKIAKSI